jgi:chemotaxis protein histidine kinase CheA
MALNLAENSIDIFREQKEKLTKENKKLKKEIQRLVQSLIPSEYVKKRSEDKSIDSWDVRKKINFAIDTVKNRERELKKEIKDKKSEITDLKLERDRAQNNLNDLQMKNESESSKANSFEKQQNKETKSESENKDSKNKDSNKNNKAKSNKEKIEQIQNKFKNKSFNKQNNNVRNKENSNNKKETSDQKNSESKQQPPPKPSTNKNTSTSDKEINKSMNNLDDDHFILIKTIGDTGIYRNKELKEKPRIMETLNTNYSLNARLNELIQADILNEKACKVGARGHNYKTFALTEKGKEVYRQKYNSEPEKSFRDWLINQHDNIKHGVLIHDTALIFEDYNYEVMMDRDNNTVDLSSQKGDFGRIVFDLTVKKSGVLKRIECERGKGNQKEFNKKLDKYNLVSKAFHFVAPNKKSLEKVKSKFFKWVGTKGGRKNVNVKMHLITLEELKKNEDKWEVYDFTN